MKEKLMNGMLSVATIMNNQKHLSSIRNSFMHLLPIIIIGSFCTLITNVVTNTTEGYLSLANISGLEFLANLESMFAAANYATMNFIAIGIVVLLAVELGESYGIKDKALPVIALGSYISLVTTTVLITRGGETFNVSNVLSRGYTNANGLFVGMIAAIATVEIYKKLINNEKLVINMPDSVPPNVARSFEILFPSAITILIISGFGMVFEMSLNMTLFDAIANFIQKPIAGIMTSLPGYLTFILMTTVLWSIGIHGTQTLKAVSEPVLIAALAQNQAAFAAGEAIPNIISRPFASNYGTITGAGITGGLIIAIFLFSKRKDFKTIAKLAVGPGLFNINEPLVFGLPIVLNPILAIPFMFTPVITSAFAYFMTDMGFAARLVVNPPWTTPIGIQAFLASGGNIGAVITQVLLVLISTLIYSPFVILANKYKEDGIEDTE